MLYQSVRQHDEEDSGAACLATIGSPYKLVGEFKDGRSPSRKAIAPL